MFNFRSFRNRLLILLVASRFASASILKTFVKNNFRIWHHSRSTWGASEASFKDAVFFTKHMLAPGLQFLPADYRAVNSGTSIDFSYFTAHICRRSK